MGSCCSVAPFPDAAVDANPSSRRNSAQRGSSKSLKRRMLSGSPADTWGKTPRAAPIESSSKQGTPSGSKCHVSRADSETFVATPNPISTSFDSLVPQELHSGAPTSLTSEVCPLTQRNLEMFASLSSGALPLAGIQPGSKDASQPNVVSFPDARRRESCGEAASPERQKEKVSCPSSTTTASVRQVLAALATDSESHAEGSFTGDPHFVSAFEPLQMPSHLWPALGDRGTQLQ